MTAEPTFSVISVFNDRELYEEWIEESVHSQKNCSWELVPIDNTDEKYDTAPEALNEGAENADGKYLAFVHQDVNFLDDKWLSRTEDILNQLDDCGIAGVIGRRTNGEWLNGVFHGLPPSDVSGLVEAEAELVHATYGDVDKTPQHAQTLDELLLIIPKTVFENHQFDEDICDGWHFYGVEYALRMNYRIEDYRAYVLPMPVWHRSMGTMDDGFYRILEDVVTEFKDEAGLRFIHATTGSWVTTSWIVTILKSRLCPFDYARLGRPVSMFIRGLHNPKRAFRYILKRILIG